MQWLPAMKPALSLVESVERLRRGLDYHMSRHNVLVSNLTQSETPGYRPLDLARSDFKKVLGVALETTNTGHLGGQSSAANATTAGFRVIKGGPAEAGGDGNSVDVDKEAMKIASNQLRYDTLAQLTQNELSDLVWAANDGRTG